MGFYSRFIFPRICNWVLDTPPVREQRRQALAPAHGNVLEIGFGTGLNLPHYPPAVSKITAIDTNPGMQRLARSRIAQCSITVEPKSHSSEFLPFPPNTFDCVVSTFTLCSIENVDYALTEVFRVLRPGGTFLFLEHGLSPDAAIERWQHRLNWIQRCLGDGCRLDRDMKRLITAQPFAKFAVDEFYLDKAPKTHGYLYRGAATK